MSTPAGRLLQLLSLLQTRRDWPGVELSRRLEVSERTVRRDVDRLRDLGYPVQASMGPDGGYRLSPGSDLPPMLFDDEQAVAVAVALQTSAPGIAGIGEAAMRALATIRQVMPARLRHRVDALQVTAVPRTGSQTTVTADTLLQIGTCCRDHQVLRFDYVDAVDVATTRVVEPHRLVSWGHRWYVVSWDRDRDAWRTFRADRMTLKTPSGPRFSPRELTEDRVRELLAPDPSYPEWEVRGTVVMQAPAQEVARWLPDYMGTVAAIDDTSCRLEVGSWSYGSLVAWLLLFEADFTVVGPPELAAALPQLAQRLEHAQRP